MKQVYYAGSLSINPSFNPEGLSLDFHFLKSLAFYSHVYKEPVNFNQYKKLYPYLEDKSLIDNYSNFIFDRLKSFHKKKNIDYFISSFLDEDIQASLINEIKNLGIITINVNLDYTYGPRFSRKLIPYFDYVLISNKKFEKEIKSLGSKSIQIDFASNPFYYRPYKKVSKTISLCSYNFLNEEELTFLYRKGINIKVYGKDWKESKISYIKSFIPYNIPFKNKNSYLKDINYIDLLAHSDIAIANGNKIVPSEDFDSDSIENSISLKDFEIPMSGLVYFRKYNSLLANFFEKDKEIIFYHEKKELLDKLSFYLKHDQERKKISIKAYKKSLDEHTWFKRIPKFFLDIGLKIPKSSGFFYS